MHADISSAVGHFERKGYHVVAPASAQGVSGRVHAVDLLLERPVARERDEDDMERWIVNFVGGDATASGVLRTSYAARDVGCRGMLAFTGEASETVRSLADRYAVDLVSVDPEAPRWAPSWRGEAVRAGGPWVPPSGNGRASIR